MARQFRGFKHLNHERNERKRRHNTVQGVPESRKTYPCPQRITHERKSVSISVYFAMAMAMAVMIITMCGPTVMSTIRFSKTHLI